MHWRTKRLFCEKRSSRGVNTALNAQMTPDSAVGISHRRHGVNLLQLAGCRTWKSEWIFSSKTHRAKKPNRLIILLKSALRAEKRPKYVFFLREAEFQQHV